MPLEIIRITVMKSEVSRCFNDYNVVCDLLIVGTPRLDFYQLN